MSKGQKTVGGGSYRVNLEYKFVCVRRNVMNRFHFHSKEIRIISEIILGIDEIIQKHWSLIKLSCYGTQ